MTGTASLSGALVIDKAEGPTSHDVVAQVRKTLHMRRVGHAGTLDPMASGVLLVLIGEGTKLEPYVSAAQKSYVATVTFGRATDTLDRMGTTTHEVAVAPSLLAELAALSADPIRGDLGPTIHAALAGELARAEQTPPIYSAIQVGGERSHARARRGEDFELPPRPVRLDALEIVGADPITATLRVRLCTSKGYYVRSFARDLGQALDVPAHLTELRRTASGSFLENEASSVQVSREALLEKLIPLDALATRALPTSTLTDRGVDRARKGQPLDADDFDAPPTAGAWMDASGRLVCIGVAEEQGWRSRRGFLP